MGRAMRKSLTKNRVIAIALCFVMAAAIIPLIVFTTAPKAEAADVDVSTWDQLLSAVNNNSGDINIRLTASLTRSTTGVTTSDIVTITAGKNVTVNLNSYSITKTITSQGNQFSSALDRFSVKNALATFSYNSEAANSRAWETFRINQGATLTITGSGTIKTTHTDTNSSNTGQDTYAMQSRTIYNKGNLYITSGTIEAYALSQATANTHGLAAFAIGVYNDGGNVYMTGGQVISQSYARPRFSGNNSGGSNENGYSYAVGIYSPSGNVNISGGYIFSKAYDQVLDGTNGETGNGTNYQLNALSIGVDLQDAGNCTLTGGSIDAETQTYLYVNLNQSVIHCNFALGIHASGTNYPTITGTGANVMAYAWHGLQGSTAPASHADISTGIARTPTAYNDTALTYFLDEYGVRQQATNFLYSGSKPANAPAQKDTQYFIKNGWMPDQAKMMHYYRIYEGPNKTYAAVGTPSFNEMTDYMKARMSGNVVFNNQSGALMNGALSASSTISSRNENYYYLGGYEYITRDNSGTSASTAVSNVDNGTAFTALPKANSQTYTIVYINIFKKLPLEAKLNLSSASIDYLGRAVTQTDIGLKFLNNADSSDVTSRFDINNTGTAALSQVTYSYEYAPADGGTAVSGVGWPEMINAGTYTIRVTVPDTTAYSETITQTAGHNIKGFTETITVTINKATPTFTPAASPYEITYGGKLSDITANPLGAVKWSQDGGATMIELTGTTIAWDVVNTGAVYEKDAGTYAHTLTITPSDTLNFNVITPSVNVKVNKKALTVSVPAVEKTYGDTPDYSGMGIIFDSAALADFDVSYAESWTAGAYAFKDSASASFSWAWNTNAGTYSYAAASISGACKSGASVADNYDITYVTAEFKINKRAVTATPVLDEESWAYTPGKDTVGITFTLSGVVNGTDCYLSPAAVTGTLTDADAEADKIVTYSTAGLTLIGSAADNYNLTINSPELKVTINKTTPAITWPTASRIDLWQTLADSTLTGGSASSGGAVVLGGFAWDNPDYEPQSPGTYSYAVTFTPVEQNNYYTVSGYVYVQIIKPDSGELIIRTYINDKLATNKLTVGQTLSAYVELFGRDEDGKEISSDERLRIRDQLNYQWIRLDGKDGGKGTVVSEESTYELDIDDESYYIRLVVWVKEPGYGGLCEGVADSVVPVTVKAKLSFWEKLIEWINSIIRAFQFLK